MLVFIDSIGLTYSSAYVPLEAYRHPSLPFLVQARQARLALLGTTTTGIES